MHRNAHLSYKRYKVQKILFQWPSKAHKYQCTQNTFFLYFSDFSIFFYFYFENKTKLKLNNQTKIDKQHESIKEICRCMKAWFQKQIRNQAKRVLLKIERIKAEDKQKRQLSFRLFYHPHSTSPWPWRLKGTCPSMTTKGHRRIRIPLKLSQKAQSF